MKQIFWDKVLVLVVIVGGILYFLALFYILFFGQQKSPEIFDNETIVRIGKYQFVAEVADTEEEQTKGLSGREDLPEGRGMLFLFDESEAQTFWMKDMKFPIDIVWVFDGRVIGVERDAPSPLREASLAELLLYVSPKPVDAVFEVRAGTTERLGIQPGDKFIFH